MRYHTIIFDIDGTLLDSEYANLHALQDTLLERTGRQMPIESLAFALGIPGEDALRQLGVEQIPAFLDRWNERVLCYADRTVLFEGVRQTLDALQAAGCRLAVVTSRTRAEYRQDMVPLGLDGYFAAVVCADDTSAHKPDPAPLLECLARLGAGQSEALYVGDSAYDSLCAQRAGVDFALALWGCRGPRPPAAHLPAAPGDLLRLAGSR